MSHPELSLARLAHASAPSALRAGGVDGSLPDTFSDPSRLRRSQEERLGQVGGVGAGGCATSTHTAHLPTAFLLAETRERAILFK